MGPTGPLVWVRNSDGVQFTEVTGGPNLQRWSFLVLAEQGHLVACTTREARESTGWDLRLWATPLGWSSLPPEGWEWPEGWIR